MTRRARNRELRRSVVNGLPAWGAVLLSILPAIWLVLTALHNEVDASARPPKPFAPITMENFEKVLSGEAGAGLLAALGNSGVASVLAAITALVLAIPAAFALATGRIANSRGVLMFLLGTKMMPLVAGLLPLYLIANWLGVLGTRPLLIIVYAAMNLPIAIWMLRSFIADIPTEVFEAAAIDGASTGRIVSSIVLPLAAPGIAATALICVIFSWNELLAGNVLTNASTATAPVFLTSFITGQGFFLAKVSAAALVVSMPILVIGLFLQKQLVQGLSFGAVR